MKRPPGTLLLIAATAAAASGIAEAQDSSRSFGSPLKVTLVAPEWVVYRKEPFLLKVTLKNDGPEPVQLAAGAMSRESFTLASLDGWIPRPAEPGGTPGGRPEPIRLAGYDSLEASVDLSAWYPGLTKKSRRWDVTWSHGEHSSPPARIAVVDRYVAKKDTTARVETELGTMIWTFLPEHAPVHVRHFVDLSRAGFYEGLSIYRVIPALEAHGGDPKHNGTGGWDRTLPGEISPTLRMETGLVGALRYETSVTSDSVFFITLGPADFMQGKQTFFARLTGGWDVIARLFRQPNRGNTGFTDAYLLERPVRILRITIH